MSEKSTIARRTFFAGIGIAGIAGIAAKLTPKTVITDLAGPASPQGDGYRLTEHIKKYYRTTTI